MSRIPDGAYIPMGEAFRLNYEAMALATHRRPPPLSNTTVVARHDLAESQGYKLQRQYETDRRGLPLYRLRMAPND